ncbi:MAG: hypothetical protein HAW67_06690 [Endozoicomonadaceae bacterium]|nr:hypothetical protein [Endozoicomonadaceae bacterium]
MKISSRPFGLYDVAEGGAIPTSLDLYKLIFDARPMMNDDFAALSLKYHFKDLLNLEQLQSDHNLNLKPHVLGAFIQKYCEVSKAQPDPTKTISLKICAAEMKNYTPREFSEKFIPKMY